MKFKIAPLDVFTNTFIGTYTPFDSLDQFLAVGGFDKKELRSLDNGVINHYIKLHSDFENLSEMRTQATKDFIRGVMFEHGKQ